MRVQMIEDISFKNDDRKNRLRRAGKPRPYPDIKDLCGDRHYKRPIYFCQGRGEVPSPALPISPIPHPPIFINPLNTPKTRIHNLHVKNQFQGGYNG
jgi:hypothetical protein